MKVIVVHEDGDRENRVSILANEIRQCVNTGACRYLGVTVEIVKITERTPAEQLLWNIFSNEHEGNE